ARRGVERSDDELVFGAAKGHTVVLRKRSALVDRGLSRVEQVGVVTDAPVRQGREDLGVAGVVRRDDVIARRLLISNRGTHATERMLLTHDPGLVVDRLAEVAGTLVSQFHTGVI